MSAFLPTAGGGKISGPLMHAPALLNYVHFPPPPHALALPHAWACVLNLLARRPHPPTCACRAASWRRSSPSARRSRSMMVSSSLSSPLSRGSQLPAT